MAEETLLGKLQNVSNVIECRYGLLVQLGSRDVFSEREASLIKVEKTEFERADKLIQLTAPRISNNASHYEYFLEALRKTGQSHVAHAISSCSDADTDNEALLSLTAEQRQGLVRNADRLITTISLMDGLLEALHMADVLNDYHVSHIRSFAGQFEKNEELLEIIKRRSRLQYSKFLRCLCRTGQRHIVHLIETDILGAPVTLEVVLTVRNGDIVGREKSENEIVTNFESLSKEMRKDLVRHILKDNTYINSLPQNEKQDMLDNLLNGVEAIGAEKKKSVALYLLCLKRLALTTLRKLYDSGELIYIIESLFNKLLTDTQSDPVHLVQHLYLIDYCRCEQFISNHLNGGKEERCCSALVELPTEVWETIVMMSFVMLYVPIMKINSAETTNSTVYEFLASVCSAWRLYAKKRKRFQEIVQQETVKLVSCVRLQKHTEFLVRNLECQFGLLEDLHQRHVITDQQLADIIYDSDEMQERSDDNKNMKLIKMMQRGTRLQKFENFLSALRDNDQEHVACCIVGDCVVDNEDDNRPLTNEELCRLEVNVIFLCDHINTETVTNDLHAINSITALHRHYLLYLIPTIKPKRNLLEELLRVLQRRSLRSFRRLMEYRCSPNTMTTIKACPREREEEVNYYGHRLQKHGDYLCSHLECLESGLLNELLRRQVLLEAQVKVIRSEESQMMQNQRLVEIMSEERDFKQHEEFLVSLWTTDQAHLAKYIINGGRAAGEPKLKLLTELDTDSHVWGVAELLGHIFIITHKALNVIRVYDCSSFKRLDDIRLEIKEEKKLCAQDMTSCSIKLCLYIYDSNNDVVWRVTDEGRGRVDEWLSIKGQNYSHTLSVTSKGRMLLSGCKPSRLDIYGPDARHEHTILLRTIFEHPAHVVETPSHDFIVLADRDTSAYKDEGRGRVDEWFGMDEVFLVNKDGDVMRSWGGAKNRRLKHASVNTEGHVFAADWRNNEVLLIDSTLSTSRVVLKANDGSGVSPCRLYWSQNFQRLIVGHYVSGHVDLFTL